MLRPFLTFETMSLGHPRNTPPVVYSRDDDDKMMVVLDGGLQYTVYSISQVNEADGTVEVFRSLKDPVETVKMEHW